MPIEVRELKIVLNVESSNNSSDFGYDARGFSRRELDNLKREILELCKEEMMILIEKQNER